MKRIVTVAFGFALSTGLLASAAAQSQSNTQSQPSAQNQPPAGGSSLGDYARQVRKQTGQPKSQPKVFDNDNLPKADKLSIVGQPAPAPAAETPEKQTAAAPGAEKKPGEAATNPEQKPTAKSSEEDSKEKQAAWKQWQQKIAAQREQIELMQRELDVTQREYQVRAAAFYADAGNRLRNSAAWDQQDQQYKQQIVEKQKAIDEAKQKLDDLLDQARKAGVPDSMISQ